MYNGITLDGTTYDVRIVYGSLQRTFAIIEGQNSGTSIGGTRIRDIIGTTYSYQMQVEPNPSNLDDYYDFYQAISSPQISHHIVLPYNNETLEFDCCIDSATDVDMGMFASDRKWGTLTIAFTPKAPQRR